MRGFLPKVTVYSAEGDQLAHLVGHRAPVGFTLFSKDRNNVYSVAVDGEIIRWNLEKLADENGRMRAGPMGTPDSFLISPTRGRYDGFEVVDGE